MATHKKAGARRAPAGPRIPVPRELHTLAAFLAPHEGGPKAIDLPGLLDRLKLKACLQLVHLAGTAALASRIAGLSRGFASYYLNQSDVAQQDIAGRPASEYREPIAPAAPGVPHSLYRLQELWLLRPPQSEPVIDLAEALDTIKAEVLQHAVAAAGTLEGAGELCNYTAQNVSYFLNQRGLRPNQGAQALERGEEADRLDELLREEHRLRIEAEVARLAGRKKPTPEVGAAIAARYLKTHRRSGAIEYLGLFGARTWEVALGAVRVDVGALVGELFVTTLGSRLAERARAASGRKKPAASIPKPASTPRARKKAAYEAGFVRDVSAILDRASKWGPDALDNLARERALEYLEARGREGALEYLSLFGAESWSARSGAFAADVARLLDGVFLETVAGRLARTAGARRR